MINDRTIEDVIASLWDGAVNDTPPTAVVDALAAACEDGPLVGQGMVIHRTDEDLAAVMRSCGYWADQSSEDDWTGEEFRNAADLIDGGES